MEIPTAQSHTPLMQQYWEIKTQHLDKILLFRMGDFYEMFFDDAIKAAPILNIALTSRSKTQGQEVAMCGVPYHSIGPQINKLLAAGLKVAICEQVENPKDAREAKKIVKRAVTRVVTPGLVYDPETLDSRRANFVCAVVKRGENTFDLAALDATTGEILHDLALSRGELSSWVEKLEPQEFIIAEKETLPFNSQKTLITERKMTASETAVEFLLRYAKETQGEDIVKILGEPQLLNKNFLKLTPTTIRHLEIFKRTDGESDYSLVWAVDLTKTPMGARLLRKRLATPFCERPHIEKELDRVETFVNDFSGRQTLREKLGLIGDLERKVARLSNSLCNARDIRALGTALSATSEVLNTPDARALFPTDTSLAQELSAEMLFTLEDELPHAVRDGGLIKPGLNAALDEFVELSTHAQIKLSELEDLERKNTGIQSLKIKYNSVFGYSFEVTKSNLEKVPGHFVRRQTMASGERYITQELSELEQKILSAQQKRCELEFQIFTELRHKALNYALHFLSLSSKIAELDLTLSWAELASQQRYCRPSFVASGFELKGSRHPILERGKIGLNEPFIPNDISLKHSQCLLLTGPNMAGKSTLMRQVALTTLLAHCGSFVPADSAHIPFIDQIFTRIGAQDNVSQGLSTFMVEMKETAEIINAATTNSLVILDEIGRGTSTYDGMSLAQAVLEHFISDVRSYTFFATHYHELTDLARERQEIINGHMSIKEYKGELIFLRKLQAGPANRSYGIDVAKKAGLPKDLTDRAQEILGGLVTHARELQHRQLNLLDRMMAQSQCEAAPEEFAPNQGDPEKEQMFLFLEEFKNLKVDSMTPLEALNTLNTLKQSLKENLHS